MNQDLSGRGPVVAVDGPAGAGKSTVARGVAEALGLLYLDTGAMYRAFTLKALRKGTDLRDESALSQLLLDATIELYRKGGGHVDVHLDGEDVTTAVRTPEVNAAVALVAGFHSVREEMVRRQRAMADVGGVVMDGRDIGTYVLPDADIKFFLTASLEARAKRRQMDLEKLGYVVDLSELQAEILHRDTLDSSRPYGPLKQAQDAIIIDTTNMEVKQVIEAMIDAFKDRID